MCDCSKNIRGLIKKEGVGVVCDMCMHNFKLHLSKLVDKGLSEEDIKKELIEFLDICPLHKVFK